MARRCLYYPFIHFRDSAWLKLSSLYWDDVTRIVPKSYVTRDSREVRALEDAGVLRRADPSPYEAAVTELFEHLLQRHERELVRRYDVARRDTWPENLERLGVKSGRTPSSSLAFLHVSKLEPSLRQRLLDSKLAMPSHDKRWLGMHPSIVAAYMISLATSIAERRGLALSSDNATHLSGAASCTVEDLARSLVGSVDLSKKRRPEGGAVNAKVTPERVAFITLQAVLPERLDGVSIKQILELRQRHAGARHAFHAYVEDVRGQLASSKITEPAALDEHIRYEYSRRLEPEMLELRRGLRALGISTFLGAFGVAVTLPLGSHFGVSVGTATALAGATLGVAALSHKHRGEARALLKPSPAAFLFVTERLRPRTLGRRLSESLQRFSLGV
jgi:hypothetical protein